MTAVLQRSERKRSLNFNPYRLVKVAVIQIYTKLYVNRNNRGIFVFIINKNVSIGIWSFLIRAKAGIFACM